MAAPVVEAGAAYSAVTAGSINTTAPATVNANDIIVIVAQAHNTAGTVATSFSWPSGFANIFTPLNNKDAGGTARGLIGAAWKRADGTEDGATLTVTHDGATGAATHFGARTFRITGCKTTGNPFAQAVTNNPNNTNTIDFPSITTTGTEKSLLTMHCNTDNNATIASLTNWTIVGTNGNNGTGSDGSNSAFKRENLSAGSYDPTSPTVANTNATGWVTFQIEFDPPAGGTTVDLVAATSTETAQTLSKTKTIRKTLSPATSTETAQALSLEAPIFKTLTPATSTETGQALNVDKKKTLGPAAETDIAQTLSKTKTIRKTLTPSASAETAQALSVTHDIIRTLTPATETDLAVSLSVGGPKTLGPALETDVARPLSFTKTIRKTLVAAIETDTAQALTKAKRKTVVAATSTETAQALTKRKRATLTPSLETDLAVQLRLPIRRTLTPALETDVAVVLASETGGEALTGMFDEVIIRGRSGGRNGGRSNSNQNSSAYTSAQSGRMEVE